MKIVAPKSFTYKGGKRAVLLLHGFTGSTVDVRKLGRYLNHQGYTCHAPLFPGHGLEAERLIETHPDEWWQSVVDAYHSLKREYQEVAVAGVSLGGVFSLKLATEYPVKAVVSMCAPTIGKSVDDLHKRIVDYAKSYKRLQGKTETEIEEEISQLNPMNSLENLKDIINEVYHSLPTIKQPLFVLQGELDDSLYIESANIIYKTVQSEHKAIQWYSESGHIITTGKERESIFKDIHIFLNSLKWKVD